MEEKALCLEIENCEFWNEYTLQILYEGFVPTNRKCKMEEPTSNLQGTAKATNDQENRTSSIM